MKERPILFSGPMVRAILDGRKTQTRRIVKPQPVPEGSSAYGGTRQGYVWKPETLNRSWNDDDKDPYKNPSQSVMATAALGVECPYGVSGDHLWVRETWAAPHAFDGHKPSHIPSGTRWHYAASEDRGGLLWRPSIHMPRVASRMSLEIAEIRVERLQDISEADAKAEGIRTWTKDGEVEKFWPCDPCEGDMKCAWADLPRSATEAYRNLWETINGHGSWDSNPWVWVITFSLANLPWVRTQT